MMANEFNLEIEYNGKPQFFHGELRMLGYTHKIYVLVNGMEVVFEPDEERNYRAVIGAEKDEGKLDKLLIQKISHELERYLK